MTFAIEWLALHIFGVLVAFALLVIVFRKDGVSWKMFRQLLCPDVYNALEKYKNSTVVYPHASCRECGILYFDCDS